MHSFKKFKHSRLLIFIFFLEILPLPNAFGKEWFVLSYAGRLGDNVLTQIVYSPHFTDSTLTAFGLGRKLLENKDYVRLELEGELVRHRGQNKFICDCNACSNPGIQWVPGQSYEKSRDISQITYYELDGVLVLRWLKFPWKKYIDINFAAGEGFSYATEYPPIEVNPHAVNHGDDQHVSRLLNYLMFELTFSLPRFSSWSFLYRVHHRSGNFGLIDGVADGSNFICLGIRYDF